MKIIAPGFVLGSLLIIACLGQATAAPQQISNNQSSTSIAGNAFANSNGVMAINQAAGVANAQANSINIVVGASKPVANSVLAQNVTSTQFKESSSPSGNLNNVAITATAFKGAEGIVQINQVSGSGNASANSFALGIAPGVIH